MEQTKYYDCPECRGQGEQMIAKMYPTGHTECWDKCEFCEGEGRFEEEDFLIMRLEGKV
jgi:DnaJ-class molecular chaperone